MAGEKIQASDLIDKSVLAELQKLDIAITSFTGKITDLMAAMKSFDETAKKGVTTQKQLADNTKFVDDTTKKLSDDEKELEKLQQKHYQTLLKITAAKSEENKKLQEATERLKRENLERKAAIDSNEGLRAKIALLRDQKEKLARTDKDYADKIKNLNNEIDKSQKLIKETDDSEQQRSKGIGKYKEGIVKAYVAIQGAIILAKGTFNLFIDAMKSTGRGADDFEASLEGLKQGFNQIKIAVSTLDFTDFTKKVRDAIAEGKRYAEGLDEIDDKTRALKISEAEQANEILSQRQIQNSALSTTKQKIEAGEKIIKIEEKLQEIRIGIADQAYQNELTNIASIANGTKMVTDEMRKEIELYVKRDENTLKSIENGQKYQDELNSIAQVSKNATEIRFRQNEKIKKSMVENDPLYKDYLLFLRVTLPKDDKYNLLVQKRIELEQAKGSAMENTLRIQSKLDSALEKSDDKQKGEEWLDRYLKRENEKREQTEKFNQYVIDQEKKKADEIEKTEEQITNDIIAQKKREAEEFEKNEEQITNDIIAQKKREAEEFEKNEERKQRAVEETRQLQIEAVNSLFDLNNTFYETDLQNLEAKQEKEINAIEDKEERGVYSSKVAAKKKEQIENEYARKIAKIKRKQAEAERIQSLFNIGVNTAQAIIKFLADPGGYQGVALSAWAAVIGAIQTAAVMAQPIPQFFKGVKNFEGGLAWTGEEGVELGETKEGNMFLTPDQATLMALPRGANIYTHERTIEMMGGMQPQSVDKLIAEQRKATEAFQNQKHYEWTPDSLIEINRKTKSRREHLDKYFRC